MRKPLAEEIVDYKCNFVKLLTPRLRFIDGAFVFLDKALPADYMAALADYNKEVTNHGESRIEGTDRR